MGGSPNSRYPLWGGSQIPFSRDLKIDFCKVLMCHFLLSPWGGSRNRTPPKWGGSRNSKLSFQGGSLNKGGKFCPNFQSPPAVLNAHSLTLKVQPIPCAWLPNISNMRRNSTEYLYTLLQKKRSMESCVSFWEECRQINFVVHDPGSGSVTKGHREKWVQKSCISFEEECRQFLIFLFTCCKIRLLIGSLKSYTGYI